MNVIERLLQQRAADIRLEQQVKAMPAKTPREIMREDIMNAEEYADMEAALNRHVELLRSKGGMGGK